MDLLTASRHRARIVSHWAARGYLVKLELVPMGFIPAMRHACYAIRSDMVNGLPRELANSGSPAALASAKPAPEPRLTNAIRMRFHAGG